MVLETYIGALRIMAVLAFLHQESNTYKDIVDLELKSLINNVQSEPKNEARIRVSFRSYAVKID